MKLRGGMKFLAVLMVLLFVSACSSAPTATPAPTVDVGAIQTQAALMVFATQTASVPTTTDTPAATSVPTMTTAPTVTETPAATPTDTPTAAGGKWLIRFGTSPLDDSKTVIVNLAADSSVTGWMDTFTPVLYLRCQEHKTEVYVDVGMQINVEYGPSDQATVRVRFDKEQAQALVANESTDRKALFLPNPTQVISAMLKHDQLVFGFTPFNASPVVTTFDLRGLSEVVQPLLDACVPPTPVPPVIVGVGTRLSPNGMGWNVSRVEKAKTLGNTAKGTYLVILLDLDWTTVDGFKSYRYMMDWSLSNLNGQGYYTEGYPQSGVAESIYLKDDPLEIGNFDNGYRPNGRAYA